MNSATRIAGLVLILGGNAWAEAAAASDTKPILRIERNKNTNEVHYRARMNADCTFKDPPVEVVWRMLEKKPVTEQSLLPREKPAYGFKVRKVAGHDATIELKAVPTRELTLHSQGTAGHCEAKLTWQSEGVTVEAGGVKVHAKESGLIPRVQWIELYGTGPTGPVRERITK